MGLAATILAIYFGLTAVAIGAWVLVCRLRGRRRRWRLVGVAVVLWFFAWWLVVVPEGLGYLAATMIGTRHFERGYEGPPVDARGRVVAKDRGVASGVDPVFFESSDGVRIRGFHLPADFTPDQPTWVLAHGLFRNAFELEPVARMLHELECPVLVVELRNHGGSARAAPSFGLRESRDVRAGVDWLRREGHADRFVLFGVSLGSIAASIAAPEVEGLVGVVLDAPIQDLAEAARGSLQRGRRRLGLPWFLLERSLGALQRWGDVRFEQVRPGDGVRALDPAIAVMLIGGGRDQRATPEQVRGLYASLHTARDRRWLWLVADSDHGDVWDDHPAEYLEHLRLVVEATR